MDMDGRPGPTADDGVTREPSGRRASTWRGFIDAAADLGDDAIDDLHQVIVIAEFDVGLFQLAARST